MKKQDKVEELEIFVSYSNSGDDSPYIDDNFVMWINIDKIVDNVIVSRKWQKSDIDKLIQKNILQQLGDEFAHNFATSRLWDYCDIIEKISKEAKLECQKKCKEEQIKTYLESEKISMTKEQWEELINIATK